MKHLLSGAVLALGLSSMCGIALAQSTPPEVVKHQERELARGEPARWLKDDATMQAQLATKRKEIGAALNEALNDCKQQAGATRNDCVKQARETYRQDLANIRELVAQSNAMGGMVETAGASE